VPERLVVRPAERRVHGAGYPTPSRPTTVTGTVCDGHAIAARLEITDGQALPGILA
jgi:hypothetical protein